jgi:hypothetical protein
MNLLQRRFWYGPHAFAHVLALLFLAFSSFGADTLVGSWQSQLVSTNVDVTNYPGLARWQSRFATNAATTNYSVLLQKRFEFLRDSTFHAEWIGRFQGQEFTFPSTGTYKILDTNHLIFEVLPAPSISTGKVRFPVGYQLEHGELLLQDWESLEGQVTKYRRVRK